MSTAALPNGPTTAIIICRPIDLFRQIFFDLAEYGVTMIDTQSKAPPAVQIQAAAKVATPTFEHRLC